MERPRTEEARLPEVSSEDLARLHRRLSELLARPLDVVGTNNRRSLLSWRVIDGLLVVRIQRQYALAPDDVLRAVARFIDSRDAEAKAAVQGYAATFTSQLPRGRAVFAPPAGRYHDLREILGDQNRRHFGGRFRGRIGWSRAPQAMVRRRIRLGSWSEEHRLIRVHPALDSAEVPAWVVAYIVFHEMLHAELGVVEAGGRRRFHTDDFREREAAHPDHERAEAWIERNRLELLSW